MASPQWLQEAVASSLRSVVRTSVPPPAPERFKRISRLSPTSPAAAAGLVPGDLLLGIAGQRVGAGVVFEPWRSLAEERRWTFWSREEAEQVTLHTTGVELGIALRPSLEAIAQRWHPLQGDLEDLYDLWEAQRYAALERRAWMHCHESTTPPGLLSWLTTPSRRDTPGLLLLGVALWERGRVDKGHPLVLEWAENHAEGASARFRALAWYYLARHWADEGVRHRAVLLLRESLPWHRLPPAALLYEELTGEVWPEDRGRWWMRPFPLDYDLEPLDVELSSLVTVGLERALAELEREQVLLVCVLGAERGSAAYDSFMWRFVNYATWLGDLVAGLHVVTIRPERDVAHPEWWDGEDTARYLGLPVRVLLDTYGRVTSTTAPPHAPTIYALGRDGVVLHEGWLDGVDVWDTLALAAERL